MADKRKTKPPHAPTPESRAQVSALYSYGITQEEIARFLNIDPKTLRLHYRDELDSAHIKANAKVGQFLFQNASGQTLKDGASHSDCVRAAMFWAKTRMGWRETQSIDHTTGGEKLTGLTVSFIDATPSKD